MEITPRMQTGAIPAHSFGVANAKGALAQQTTPSLLDFRRLDARFASVAGGLRSGVVPARKARARNISPQHAIPGNKKPALRAGFCLTIGGGVYPYPEPFSFRIR